MRRQNIDVVQEIFTNIITGFDCFFFPFSSTAQCWITSPQPSEKSHEQRNYHETDRKQYPNLEKHFELVLKRYSVKWYCFAERIDEREKAIFFTRDRHYHPEAFLPDWESGPVESSVTSRRYGESVQRKIRFLIWLASFKSRVSESMYFLRLSPSYQRKLPTLFPLLLADLGGQSQNLSKWFAVNVILFAQ